MKNWLLIFAFLLAADAVFGQWKFSFLVGAAANFIGSARNDPRIEYSYSPNFKVSQNFISEKRGTGLGIQIGLRIQPPAKRQNKFFAEVNLHRVKATRIAEVEHVWTNQNEVLYTVKSKLSIFAIAYSIPVGYRFKLPIKKKNWAEIGVFFQGNVSNQSRQTGVSTNFYTFDGAADLFVKNSSPVFSAWGYDVNFQNAIGYYVGFSHEISDHFSMLFRLKEAFFLQPDFYFSEGARRMLTFELTGVFSNFQK